MANYLSWKQKQISDFSLNVVKDMYDNGFFFTRLGNGVMKQTRSIRVDLSRFELSSENRRVMKKVSGMQINYMLLPIRVENYSWKIHKLGKEFYNNKFGEGTFSAAKIKELITNNVKSNFNLLFKYTHNNSLVGYCISYQNDEFLHYAYPFYDIEKFANNFGLGMMLTAIIWAKEQKKKYMYLGSASSPKDKYKLQFKGVEWFDKEKWNTDLEPLKQILKESTYK